MGHNMNQKNAKIFLEQRPKEKPNQEQDDLMQKSECSNQSSGGRDGPLSHTGGPTCMRGKQRFRWKTLNGGTICIGEGRIKGQLKDGEAHLGLKGPGEEIVV